MKDKNIPKVAIIVPVYNQKEEYLDECISSALAQTYRNFEIVIVDDGSERSTADHLDAIEKQDSKIRVIHSENKGPSAARNIGIDNISDADYITFLDSDDILEPGMLDECIREAEELKADVVCCTHTRHTESGKQSGDCEIPTRVIFEEKDLCTFLRLCLCSRGVENYRFPYLPAFWGKLFRAEIFTSDPDMRFDLSLRQTEDQYLMQRMVPKLERIVLIGQELYSYRLNDNSLVREKREDFIEGNMHAFDLLDVVIDKKNTLLREAFDNYRAGYLVLYGTSYIYHPNSEFSCREKRELLKNAVALGHFRESLKNIRPKYFRKGQYLYLLCARIRFYGLALIAAKFGAKKKWSTQKGTA